MSDIEEVAKLAGTPQGARRGRQRSAVVIAKERRRLALELRKRGYTFDQIAAAIYRWGAERGYAIPRGYDRRNAWRDVHRELEALDREIKIDAQAVLRLELERLDLLLKAAMKKAIAGNLHSIDRVLKIMERRDKLLKLSESAGINQVVEIEIY